MKFSTKTVELEPLMFQTNYLQKIVEKVSKAREETIMDQLNDFISRGLIEVQIIGSQFVRSADSNNVVFTESVRLVLKDKEYIEKLEKENAELKEYKKEILRLLNEGK